jgi:hypothetical protein
MYYIRTMNYGHLLFYENKIAAAKRLVSTGWQYDNRCFLDEGKMNCAK